MTYNLYSINIPVVSLQILLQVKLEEITEFFLSTS